MRQSRPTPLAAAEAAGSLEGRFAGQSEPGQQVAAILLVEVLAFGTDCIHYPGMVIQCTEVLVEIADPDAVADDHSSGVRLYLPDQASQQRGLPRAVRPQHPPTLAPGDVERDIAEKRPVVRLGEMLHPQHHVPASSGRWKAHRRGEDLSGPLDRLDSGQLLAAVFRLGVFLPVKVSSNEPSGLLDLRLLLLVGPALDQKPLGLLPPVSREVARIALHRAVEQFQRAVCDPVEEIAVVADQDHRRRTLGEEVFQPLGRLDVEVVGGLVQKHQFGLAQ